MKQKEITADLDQQMKNLAIEFIEEVIGRVPSDSELNANYFVQGNFGENFDLQNIVYEHYWNKNLLFVADKNGKILEDE